MDACPYCGAPVRQGGTSGQQINVAGIGVLIVLSMVAFLALNHFGVSRQGVANQDGAVSSGFRESCQIAACPAGTTAVTRAAEQQPYYTCKSSALSDYANYVLSVTLEQVQFAGFSPKISAQTGEPDVQGEKQANLDRYRARAGVATFEQALASCYKGRGGIRVVVLYGVQGSDSLYVSASDNPEEKFWLPRRELDKL